MKIIQKYFPDLSDRQCNQFIQLKTLFEEWNAQINLVSRKDMENFYERHVLHSLSISKMLEFKTGTSILDVGTGGGLPGIPLAILFPECQFHLVDSIGKKIKVVNEITTSLELTNVVATHCRAEQVKDKYDFVVSRAVTRMSKFLPLVQNSIKQDNLNVLPNGILYLKGGDLREEMQEIDSDYDVLELNGIFDEEFFETKKVVYVRINLR
ncbi:16S rRNA (guanine(527)-N(7))-methyltransferase RsmG [Flavobacteriales bacterium]|nr:16S rRNA (guanine(527)-N(7))-methyltransferase RsmG [Flavobacteriales bacterium]